MSYLNKVLTIRYMVKIMNECCNRYDEQGNHLGNKCYQCEEWSDDNYCCCSYNRKEATALYDSGFRHISCFVSDVFGIIDEFFNRYINDSDYSVYNLFNDYTKYKQYLYSKISEGNYEQRNLDL